ncbi:MAG: hypothetical protein MSS52_02285, partial [Prevotella sp.]|nr:hypothetical protein [Prevotella sp.]
MEITNFYKDFLIPNSGYKVKFIWTLQFLHFAIHIVWRANVICTYRKSGIARKTTVAYPELRL